MSRGLATDARPRPAVAAAIAAAAPAAAVPRPRKTVGLVNIGGGYEGARSDRRATQDWNPLDAGPNSTTLGDLPTLRARSADAARNIPLASGAFKTLQRDVIGDGLVPKPRLDREYLGLSAEQAAAWARHAMRIYWAHASTTRFDIAGRLTIAEQQRQALFAFLGGGDCFALFRYRVDAGDLLGVKLQIVEASRVSQPDTMPETERFRDGLETDSDGRLLRVWFANRHRNERWLPGGGALTWSPRAMRDAQGWPITQQLLDQERPGQLRGVPYLAPVLEVLKNLSRYSEAELMAAVVSSMFTVFVKGGFNPGLAELDENAPSNAGQIKLGTGAIVDLAENESIEMANPTRPNANFDPFFLAMCRQLGAALEIPYEQLVNHFQASYSASRAALLNAWRSVRTKRGWFVNSLMQPFYAQVIRESVARGYLQAPGFFDDPLARAAWLGCEWTGPAMPEIDPVKAVDAAAKRVKEGFSTREREAAELTGTDFDENHEQRVVEERKRRAAGLDVEDVAERTRIEPITPEAPATPSGAPAKPGEKTEDGADVDSDLETADVA